MLNKQGKKKMLSVLFPDKPRHLPYRRTIRISFRALHILCAGVLLGGHIFNQPVVVLEPWLWGTVMTGLVILLTDIHSSMAFFFELRGIAVLLKVILLLLIPVFWEQRIALLIAVLLVGAVSSHLPKRYRHRLFFLPAAIQTDHRSG